VAIPSFVEGIQKGRGWIDQALCWQEPHDSLRWIVEASGGTYPPVSTARLLDVCARCPVHWECLLDAVSERAFTVTACWGGRMTTERVAVVEQERRRLKAERTPEPIVLERSGFDQEPGSPVPSQDRLTERDEHEIRLRAAAVLKASFAERLASWQRRARSTDEPAGCCHVRASGAASSSSPRLGFTPTAARGAEPRYGCGTTTCDVAVPALREPARLAAAIRRDLLLGGVQARLVPSLGGVQRTLRRPAV
jgi:hypothetical protein